MRNYFKFGPAVQDEMLLKFFFLFLALVAIVFSRAEL